MKEKHLRADKARPEPEPVGSFAAAPLGYLATLPPHSVLPRYSIIPAFRPFPPVEAPNRGWPRPPPREISVLAQGENNFQFKT